MLAYLFDSRGNDIVSRDYYAPGRYVVTQETADIADTAQPDDIVELIGPYGIRRTYVVACTDGTTACLMRRAA